VTIGSGNHNQTSAKPSPHPLIKQTTAALARMLVERESGSVTSVRANWIDALFPNRRNKPADSEGREKELLALVQALLDEDIDIERFAAFLSADQDRQLKRKFANRFLVATALFTILSYAVVILDRVFKLEISQTAITSLIIEIPIQFVGLLYIIARNLFPSSPHAPKQTSRPSRRR